MSTPQENQARTLKFTLLSKNVLSLEESELYELANQAGILIDPEVFKILVELLRMNVAPTAIIQMLRTMIGKKGSKHHTGSGESQPTAKTHTGRNSRTKAGHR
ncbi:mitotic-spindle organizing protein 2-like [Lingula anatina]|uniref:Mitotic-spindle organizing protein 2-like n=1 Tax=Lingula anatina TaxID=7574 RepID=A0A1S3J4K8_LINAN|nr:mitotic-spindle organizing protein 2-like [Lingula anatina]|eukprot:XP_013405372.1 mitotic-spindle organizing protein 2-like [Lingula anatina]